MCEASIAFSRAQQNCFSTGVALTQVEQESVSRAFAIAERPAQVNMGGERSARRGVVEKSNERCNLAAPSFPREVLHCCCRSTLDSINCRSLRRRVGFDGALKNIGRKCNQRDGFLHGSLDPACDPSLRVGKVGTVDG
eukprot:scaffold212398_cov31-Tisochrysis_lutea.AAC.1